MEGSFPLKYSAKEVNKMTMPHSLPPLQPPAPFGETHEPDALEIDEALWDRLWLTFRGVVSEGVSRAVDSVGADLKRRGETLIVSLEESHWNQGEFRVLIRIPVNTEREDEYKLVKPFERALLPLGGDLESWGRVWREEPNDAERILKILTFCCDGCGKHFTVKDRAATLWFSGWGAQAHCPTCAASSAQYDAKEWAANAAAQAAGGKFFDQGHVFSDLDLQFEHGMEFQTANETFRVAYEAGRQGVTVLVEPSCSRLAFADKDLGRVQRIYTQVTGRQPKGSASVAEAND